MRRIGGLVRPACATIAVLCVALDGELSGMTLDDVMIRDFEVRGVCEKVEGEHPVSIQPGVQFRMSREQGAGEAIYGTPSRKAFQSFDCGRTRTTIYYYEFPSADELMKRLPAIKAVLWGEEGPTSLHPELVLPLHNVLAVVSSRQAVYFSVLLGHRLDFPDLEDDVIERRLRRMKCGKEKPMAPDLCRALEEFRSGRAVAIPTGAPMLLVGRYWESAADAERLKTGYEGLYLGRDSGSGSVASFGEVEPEDEDEVRQVRDQLMAQSSGDIAASAAELLGFMRKEFGSSTAAARLLGGRTLAFLGIGGQIYVRQGREALVLTTQHTHGPKEDAFVVATFPWSFD